MDIVFADFAHDTLKPLTWTRSVLDIEVGGGSLGAHAVSRLPVDPPVEVFVPAYLRDITRVNDELYEPHRHVVESVEPGSVVVNPAALPTTDVTKALSALEPGTLLADGGTPVALVPDRSLERFADLAECAAAADRVELDASTLAITYPWDLDRTNERLLETDVGRPTGALTELNSGVDIVGDGAIAVGSGVEISPGAVLDPSEGPIRIDDGAVVGPQTRIEGPAYVGRHAAIGVGENAVVHGKSHIGAVSQVGGEVGSLVLHAFSNKKHYGFLGHSVVGSWVNVGAGTSCSDLKNTYGTVTVNHPTAGKIRAGQKVGPTIGDHVRTGIQSAIHSGKQIGPYASLIGRVDRDISPFTWQDADGSEPYDPARAATHIRRMMTRRERYLPAEYVDVQEALLGDLAARRDG